MKKNIKYTFLLLLVLVVLYFFPIFTTILIFCGFYDVLRNKELDFSIVKQYFFGNGTLTWFASPLNVLLDVFSLPYINKGVYKLEDLPEAHQREINVLLELAKKEKLVEKLEERAKGLPRAMFFFKWYGKDQESFLDYSALKKDFQLIKTIGVSAFREKESTSRHFGPFRPSLRVLYCLNDVENENVYIKVGKVENKWKENKLFIFDDTLLHQSFNGSDKPRYCLFIDILRPAKLNFINNFAVSMIRIFLQKVKPIFYKKWTVIQK